MTEIEFYPMNHTIDGLEKSEWSIEQHCEDAILCDPDFNIHADTSQEEFKRDGFVPLEPETWQVYQCESWEYTGKEEDSVSCPIILLGKDNTERDAGFLHMVYFKEV